MTGKEIEKRKDTEFTPPPPEFSAIQKRGPRARKKGFTLAKSFVIGSMLACLIVAGTEWEAAQAQPSVPSEAVTEPVPVTEPETPAATELSLPETSPAETETESIPVTEPSAEPETEVPTETETETEAPAETEPSAEETPTAQTEAPAKPRRTEPETPAPTPAPSPSPEEPEESPVETPGVYIDEIDPWDEPDAPVGSDREDDPSQPSYDDPSSGGASGSGWNVEPIFPSETSPWYKNNGPIYWSP